MLHNDHELYQACQLVVGYTDGSCRLDDLRGPRSAKQRKHIMRTLTAGNVKSSAFGVMRSALLERAKISGTCRADDDGLFRDACRREFGVSDGCRAL